MANLITDSQAKAWLSIADNEDDALIAALTSAVSRQVRAHCGRSFNSEASQVASARYYTPLDYCTVIIDDAYEITSVATDNGDDGTYSTTWSTSDWYAYPANQQGPAGDYTPYTFIKAVESREFPYAARPSVKVIAKWGWADAADSESLDDVELACRMLLGEFYKAKDGGYETFTTDNGFTAIRRNTVVRDLLQPYKRERATEMRFVVM